jgi:hypothetical protein
MALVEVSERSSKLEIYLRGVGSAKGAVKARVMLRREVQCYKTPLP